MAVGVAVGYTASLVYLSNTWYKQTDRRRFHFFNDNREWLQLDKAGHFWGAFHESRLGVDVLRTARIPEKKAVIYGGLLGFVLQSPIELLDGYAADYGASTGDLVANGLGSAAVIAQQLLWQELRLQPKFSFRPSPYAPKRPQVLGSNLPEQILKDYNGQTYWIVADMPTFLPGNTRYPKWLNPAMGYGGTGMVYGEPATNKLHAYQSYRQYYLSVDFNLNAIRTRHKFLKRVFYVLQIIHLPAPAVSYNRKQGFGFYPLYF